MTHLLRAHKGRAIALLPLLLVGALAVACSNGSDTATPPVNDPATELGSAVYAASCASCHGAGLRGTDQGPSHLSIVYEPNHHPDDAFRSAIANGSAQHHWGFGAMPPVEGLSDADVEAVIAFVRAEQQRLGFEE